MADFYSNHPLLFHNENRANGNHIQLTLAVYLMRQQQLGEDSLWAPWIAQMPEVTFYCEYDIKDILETKDDYLIQQALLYKEGLTDEWDEIKAVLENYRDLFSDKIVTRQCFLSAYAAVCTRNFGYGIPTGSMIPMADNFNHSDVNMICEMITKSLHLQADQTSTYYNKNRLQNNYTALFNESEFKTESEKQLVKGTFEPVPDLTY